MSKVFLAYKNTDIARANVVRRELEALGVDLFMDIKITAGENYISALNAQLEAAAAVLVLWTEASVKLPGVGERNFVLGEAERGYSRHVLVAASFDKIAQQRLPVPFNTIQAPNLSDWIETGASGTYPQWQNVLEALGRVLDRPGLAGLAETLADGSDDARRRFVREHPGDPFALRFASDIEVVERQAFEVRMQAAEKRLHRHAKDGERRLKTCRQKFEAELAGIRMGRTFTPPDPLDALLEPSGHAGSADELMFEVTALKEEVAAKDAQIAAHQDQLAQTQTAASQARQSLELREREIAELKDDNAAFARSAPRQTRSLVGAAGLGIAAAILLADAHFGFLLGPSPREKAVAARENDLQRREVDANIRADALAKSTSGLEAETAAFRKQEEQATTYQANLVSRERALETRKAEVQRMEEAVNAKAEALDRLGAELDAKISVIKGAAVSGEEYQLVPKQANLEQCSKRCVEDRRCKVFTYWYNQNCYLFDRYHDNYQTGGAQVGYLVTRLATPRQQ